MKKPYTVPEFVKQHRKIKPTRRSVSGVYPFRGDEPVEYESTLERDFLIRTDALKGVVGIIPQPVQMPFTHINGQTYTYTPDFLVFYRAGSSPHEELIPHQLVEVKYRDDLKNNWHELKPKFKAAARFAREQGYVFKLMDEHRIRDQFFKNVVYLQRYKRLIFDEIDSAWIVGNVARMGMATFDYVVSRHFIGQNDKAVGITHVWHLLAVGRLTCDMSAPFSPMTELWVPTNEQ